MTIDSFRSIVRNLSNSTWCRHWINWNHPVNPREMAISCVEFRDKGHGLFWRAVLVPDLLKEGFREERREDGLVYYIIGRTNDNGTPFESDIRVTHFPSFTSPSIDLTFLTRP